MLQPPRSIWPIIDNAMEAWKVAGMGTAMLNSAIYGVVGAAAAVFIASLAAFGLSRIACIGRQGWFMLIFAGTLFPFQTFLIPLFFGFQKTGLINTREGMLLLCRGDLRAVPDAGAEELLRPDPDGDGRGGAHRGLQRVARVPLHRPAERTSRAAGGIPAAIHLDLERPAVRLRAGQRRGRPFHHGGVAGVPGRLCRGRAER